MSGTGSLTPLLIQQLATMPSRPPPPNVWEGVGIGAI
jgi:hypothetical protein